VLQERIENICKTVQDLEGKNQSLQLTVDRLSLSLAKTEEEESVQKVGGLHCVPINLCQLPGYVVLLVWVHNINMTVCIFVLVIIIYIMYHVVYKLLL